MSFRKAGFLIFALMASTDGFLANETLASSFGKMSLPATAATSKALPDASRYGALF